MTTNSFTRGSIWMFKTSSIWRIYVNRAMKNKKLFNIMVYCWLIVIQIVPIYQQMRTFTSELCLELNSMTQIKWNGTPSHLSMPTKLAGNLKNSVRTRACLSTFSSLQNWSSLNVSSTSRNNATFSKLKNSELKFKNWTMKN